MTSKGSRETMDFEARLVQAIDEDLRAMGLSLSSQADLERACDLLERFFSDSNFPATVAVAKELRLALIARAKRAFENIPHSGSLLEDYGQENYWEEYKLQMQRSHDGPHTETYQETMRACCDSVSEELSRYQNRVLNVVIFGPNEENGDEPVTASDLMYQRLEEIAGFEPLLNDPDEEDEVAEKVDENGDPLFSETIDDEPLFEEIRNFVEGLVSMDLDPPTLCQVAITLNYLDRMPRKTPDGCQLTIAYRCNGELSYASLEGDEECFALRRGGTVDSGAGSDSHSEDDFVRAASGHCVGDMYEIQQWVSFSQELINLGGTISSESLAMEDHTWDDGDSSSYWELLE